MHMTNGVYDKYVLDETLFTLLMMKVSCQNDKGKIKKIYIRFIYFAITYCTWNTGTSHMKLHQKDL